MFSAMTIKLITQGKVTGLMTPFNVIFWQFFGFDCTDEKDDNRI